MSRSTSADDRCRRDGRVGGEIIGAEQAQFLAGVGDEHHRAARRLARCDEGARRLEHRRDAGGIVERAIVDRVVARLGVWLDGRDGRGGPSARHIRRASARVAAGQHADHFGAREVLPRRFGCDREPRAKREAARAAALLRGLGADRGERLAARRRTAARPCAREALRLNAGPSPSRRPTCRPCRPSRSPGASNRG